MFRLWRARGIRGWALGLSLGLVIAWVSWNAFGEWVFFGFAQFVLTHPLWLSLPVVAIGNLASAVVIVELWRAISPDSIMARNHWVTIVVALGLFAISGTGLLVFKSSYQSCCLTPQSRADGP